MFVGDVSYDSGPDGLFRRGAGPIPCKGWGFPCAGSKPAPPPGFCGPASIFPAWSASRARSRWCPSPLKQPGNCETGWTAPSPDDAGDETGHPRQPPPFAAGWRQDPRGRPPLLPGASRIRSSALRTRSVIRCLSNPAAFTRMKCISRVFPLPLPVDVQLAFLRTIPGLERVRVMRPAYAIEYDCCDLPSFPRP